MIECRNRIPHGRILAVQQAARDPLFVEVSVGSEGDQAGVLILPTEAPTAIVAGRFQDWNLDERSGNTAAALVWLTIGDRKQRVAVYRFYVPIAQGVQRHPESSDGFCSGHTLLKQSIDRAIVDQRAARCVYKRPRGILVAG